MSRHPGANDPQRACACQSGFTLLEVLVALFLIGLGVLAAAPMFIYATQEIAVGGDFGAVGAAAVDRMEQLRAEEYSVLAAGGSLQTNATGYSDISDPDLTVRWSIVDNTTPPRTKTIEVRAIATRQITGQRKEITLTSIRGSS